MKPTRPFWAKSKAVKHAPTRTREQINAEYSQACAEAGHIDHKLFEMQERLAELRKLRVSLGQELAKVDAAEAEERKRQAQEKPLPQTLPTAPPRPEETK